MRKMRMNRKMVFIFTIVFVLCCFMTTSSWAAKKVKFLKANKKDYIRQLNENNSLEATAIGPVLGLTQNEEFKLLRKGTDFNRVTHKRFQQSFYGVPVWGMETVVSVGPDGKVVNLHGDMVLDTKNDIKSIPANPDPLGALKDMQEKHKEKDLGAIWNFRNEQYGTFIVVDEKQKARVCYVVSFFADTDCGSPSQPIFFINAKNGKVIDSYDMLRFADGVGPGGNLKVGYYYYGTDYPPFCVAANGSTCTMNCTDIKTVDLNHGTSGTTAYSYTCYENTHEQINGAYCPLNDAQYFGQVVFDTYMDWYGLAVLPFQLTLRCHYSTNYENAFWDGSTMTFGDGYTTFYPLVSLDVVAHEVSHGFTDYHSDLIYSGQSGGINESFSDQAGEAAKYYMRGTNDFMCGYDIFKNPTGALRYLYDPPLDGISIDHVDDYYEGMDVHYSSGIFNKAFYLIAVSPGWTTRMSFDIFVKANTDYWQPSTNFQQGGEGALDAAMDYGYNCQDVVNAFATVGIPLTCPGPPIAWFVGSPTSGGAPLTVNFTDQSTNSPTSWVWDFGDTGTSTQQNPSHTYTSPGNYTVTLFATNASGSDSETKTNYITVLLPQPPVAEFTASSTSISVGDSVNFTDQSTNAPTSWSWTFSGGTPGTSTAQNPTITYNTVGMFTVTLIATNAQGSDTETKVDYINVADKPYCTSSGGSQGYEYIAGVAVADLNNSSGASPYTDYTNLSANVNQGDTVSVSLTPGFVSSSYTEWWKIWIDYNGDHDFEDTGEEVFAGSGSSVVNGSFTVPTSTILGDTRMRVSMSYSTYPPICGTFTYGEVEDYTANISDGGCQVPVADFSASATTIYEGDSIDFTDLSTNSPDTWDWVFNGGIPATSTDQNPTGITYNTAGTYTVTLTATNACGSDVETKTNYITVEESPPTGITFETGKVTGVGNSWQTVTLQNSYTSMVVVCSTGLLNSSTLPAVTRVRNASGNSFDVMVQNPSGSALSGYTVHYFVVEEGVYTVAGDGVKMEAVKVTSTATARQGSWVLEARSYQNSYTSPVVLGQVMTYNDAGWSVFWASGLRANPPSAGTFNAGKHVGEDTDTTRANETIGYVVFEQGSGTINSKPFRAAVGADIVQGPGNTSTGYTYTFGSVANANVAIVSAAGMDGGNGGWPVMYGATPLTSTSLTMVFDEDQVADSERNHVNEQVAYIVFGQ